MDQVQGTIQAANSGLINVFSHDNIAIVVLMVCLCLSAAFNIFQMNNNYKKDRERHKENKETLDLFLTLNNTLNQLVITISTLNERLHHDR